jgi:ATP-dependent Clp protease adaptor protein ClpS
MKTNPRHKEEQETDVLDSNGYMLIVWNDDVNTFDWVIKTLVEVCRHEPEQAEQCAILIHYKGKTDVKRGAYEELKTMCEAIIDRGIGATVEELKGI